MALKAVKSEVLDGCMGGWMGGKVVLRFAYNNQKVVWELDGWMGGWKSCFKDCSQQSN